MTASTGPGLLSRWLLFGEWRAHPVRAMLAIVAIAVGVAMGFAIHLINAAAFNEFSAAIKSLAGQADIQVSASEAWFDESLYPRLATRPGVAVASPVLQVQAAVPGVRGALSITGIDALRAGYVTPSLLGAAANLNDVLADDAIFLSPALQAWLKVAPGATLTLGTGASNVKLRVAGALTQSRSGQRVAVMDIAALQWRFHQLGKLSRIDLKLQPGVNRDAFQRERLEPQALVHRHRHQQRRGDAHQRVGAEPGGPAVRRAVVDPARPPFPGKVGGWGGI